MKDTWYYHHHTHNQVPHLNFGCSPRRCTRRIFWPKAHDGKWLQSQGLVHSHMTLDSSYSMSECPSRCLYVMKTIPGELVMPPSPKAWGLDIKAWILWLVTHRWVKVHDRIYLSRKRSWSWMVPWSGINSQIVVWTLQGARTRGKSLLD